MTVPQQDKLPFVLFQIKGGLYAVSSGIVREIVTTPQVTAVAQAPLEVRGVINLRGQVLKLIDLRVKLGLPTLRAELNNLIQLLKDREQDHRNWLAELESCVRERRPFKMARDPHRCKFGLWYDQFKTQDRLLRMTLPAMDAPHKAIHATADAALSQAQAGDFEAALQLIEARRNRELAGLIKLFEESRRILAEGNREVAIILSRGGDRLAFTADLVEAVEHIPQESIEQMPVALAGLNGGLRCHVAKRLKSNQTTLLLSDDFLFSPPAMN
jgi:purine-binding chemotaxis protein CheW